MFETKYTICKNMRIPVYETFANSLGTHERNSKGSRRLSLTSPRTRTRFLTSSTTAQKHSLSNRHELLNADGRERAKKGEKAKAQLERKSFDPETNLEDDAPGQLAETSVHCLMQCMYMARYARHDIRRAVGALTPYITCWKAVHDRKLLRLIEHINSTLDSRQIGFIGGPLTQLS